MDMLYNIFIVFKSLFNGDLMKSYSDDHSDRKLKKMGLGWLLSKDVSLTGKNIFYNGRNVGCIVSRDMVVLFDHHDLYGVLAHHVIRKLSK